MLPKPPILRLRDCVSAMNTPERITLWIPKYGAFIPWRKIFSWTTYIHTARSYRAIKKLLKFLIPWFYPRSVTSRRDTLYNSCVAPLLLVSFHAVTWWSRTYTCAYIFVYRDPRDMSMGWLRVTYIFFFIYPSYLYTCRTCSENPRKIHVILVPEIR